MAGRGKKKLSTNSTVANWLVGIYTRRSFDDNEDKESNTITNQKEMINSFISKEKNMTIVDYYVDDGYTGTTFEAHFSNFLSIIFIMFISASTIPFILNFFFNSSCICSSVKFLLAFITGSIKLK